MDTSSKLHRYITSTNAPQLSVLRPLDQTVPLRRVYTWMFREPLRQRGE